MFDWTTAGYNTIGAVMVKAGTGYNVYTYSPQAYSDAGLYATPLKMGREAYRRFDLYQRLSGRLHHRPHTLSGAK